MVRVPTLVLGATLGLAGLGVSNAASAGVHFGIGIGLPIPAVVAAPPVVVASAPVVAPAPVVAYPPVAYGYYGPGYYGPYYHGYRAYPRAVVGWHPGYAYRGGYWHR